MHLLTLKRATRAFAPRTRHVIRPNSTSSPSPKEFKVLLDNQTLYTSKELAEALGYKPDQGTEGTKLSLHGWGPSYFTITPTGTDSELLARSTVESGRSKNVQTVLEYLKER